jgi:hypothetical protein
VGCTGIYNWPYSGLVVDGCTDVTIVGGDFSYNNACGIEVRSGTTANVFIQAHPVLKGNLSAAIGWYGTNLNPGQNDANGWYLTFDESGKRRWRRNQNIVAPAVVDATLATYSLPVGVSNIHQVDSMLSWRGDYFPQKINVVLQVNFNLNNAFTVRAYDIANQNLNVHTSNFEINLELIER